MSESVIESLVAECEIFKAEIARLTAALHKLEAHPDYEYDRNRESWERNPEAETPGGDECWRRMKT